MRTKSNLSRKEVNELSGRREYKMQLSEIASPSFEIKQMIANNQDRINQLVAKRDNKIWL